jgi:hypothetical protein
MSYHQLNEMVSLVVFVVPAIQLQQSNTPSPAPGSLRSFICLHIYLAGAESFPIRSLRPQPLASKKDSS